MRIDELKTSLTTLDLPIEFGFEKEFLLQARSKTDGKIYNLNLAREFLLFLSKVRIPYGHSIVEEYSRCLVEVVSKPYRTDTVFDGLKKINQMHSFIESKLRSFVKRTYPRLTEYYDITLSDRGSSPANQYLCYDLEILSDQKYPADIVLPQYKKYIERYGDTSWRVGKVNEKIIGTYNHINSFHITFHPTYAAGFSFENYITTLSAVRNLILKYEKYDKGNKGLYRNGKKIKFEKNVRDLFLKKFLRLHAGECGMNFSIPDDPADAAAYFVAFTKKLTGIIGTLDIDRSYKNWSAYNMRPRVINNQIPGVEIRQFGSNFSRSKYATKLINEIIKIDSKLNHIPL